MPLRTRVILLNALVLCASMALGLLVAGYQVHRELMAELSAAMAGARQAAAASFEDLPRSDHPMRDLRQLVEAFDGNRHVRVSLVDAGHHDKLLASRFEDPLPPPRWFRQLMEVNSPAVGLPVPGALSGSRILLLTPNPAADIRAAWDQGLALTAVMAVAASMGLGLVWLVIGAALKPLRLLASQFQRIGAGDYTVYSTEAGPPEVRLLQHGFNLMTQRLGASTHRNRQLGEQLARLQEEERAEIARDLHDEIGPHLFAVSMDAALIVQMCETGQPALVAERAKGIQTAVTHMQRQVRDLLGWLRPTQLIEFGLHAAIEELARFWTLRRPDMAFDLALSEIEISPGVAEVAYRIVQEGVSNAMRHAHSRKIGISVADETHGWLSITVENDGKVVDQAKSTGGLGLVGMRERVEAGGGQLTHGPHTDGQGWIVRARLPLGAPEDQGIS